MFAAIRDFFIDMKLPQFQISTQDTDTINTRWEVSESSIIPPGEDCDVRISSATNQIEISSRLRNVVLPIQTPLAFSSFGVFDGKRNRSSSSICEISLNSAILNEYADKFFESAAFNVAFGSSTCQTVEQYLCESIGDQFKAMDMEIKMTTTHGSCALSLFLMEYKGGEVRALCAWVGDSRCVAFRCYDEFSDNSSFQPTYETIVMSQDHVPTLHRECHRIRNQLTVKAHSSPIELDSSTFASNQPDIFIDLYTSEPKMRSFIDVEGEMIDPVDLCNHPTLPILHNKSFVHIPNGENDNEENKQCSCSCVYSRYGVPSVTTRSLGFKYGPRSCISQPDISAITILPNHHTRFVLAPASFWQVMSERVVAEVALNGTVAATANSLCELASQLRSTAGLAEATVCVQIIEVNGPTARINGTGSFAHIACVVT